MSTGTILAHKHTLIETYAGFFRALATESFSAVRHWLHPELERLIRAQCVQSGEASFLRSLRHGLGSASQRLRLGSSQAEGAGQIRTQLLNDYGDQAGSVRFVLSGDGWRIYAVEVWTSPKPEAVKPPAPVVKKSAPTGLIATFFGNTTMASKKTSFGATTSTGVPKMLASRWLSKAH